MGDALVANANARRSSWRRVAVVPLFAAIAGVVVGRAAPAQVATPAPAAEFAATIAKLSEPGGFFDTDNLISNERSYLHVVPDLALRKVRGGIYLGVGPDQNFSYIAQVQPSLALLVDIRRDNLLLHLLFKAIFSLSDTRAGYLATLTGRAPPVDGSAWNTKSVDEVVAYVDAARPVPAAALSTMTRRIRERITSFGVPISEADLATVDRFHRTFIEAGLSLQFNSTGRAPQQDYPRYRDLLLERDRAGVRQSFVATEAAFQFVRRLQAQHRVVPIVGDLAGTGAMPAIAQFLQGRGERVSAFYTSNVEFYLFRNGVFPRFMANLARLPRTPEAVIIRGVFGGFAPREPGYNSASLLQPVQALLEGYARGQFRQYNELAIAR
jgi:hypothetical protein